jgi:hypothetical protein
MPSNEYRYLRDFIKQDSKWENAEYTNFIHALNEKHIPSAIEFSVSIFFTIT